MPRSLPLFFRRCRERSGIGMAQTKQVFLTVFLFAHGYASIIANNSMKYDEAVIDSQLQQAYRGAILAAREDAI